MQKNTSLALGFGILFLFLIQSMGSLVESIYILDLLKTSLDEKALGLLFFFAPVLLWIFPKKPSKKLVWGLFGVLLLSRGILPYLPTLGRMLASGFATAAGLLLFPFLLSPDTDEKDSLQRESSVAVGMALAILTSVFLRTINYSFDYSLQSEGGWVGWFLGIVLGIFIYPLSWEEGEKDDASKKPRGITLPVMGIYLVMALSLFAFSAPAVIARWCGSDYRAVILAVSFFSALWVLIEFYRPNWINGITPAGLILWNVLFTITLSGSLLAMRVSFPPAPDSPPVIAGSATTYQQILVGLTLLLFPVIFFGFASPGRKIEKPGDRSL